MFDLKKFLGLDYYVSPPDQFLIDYTQKHPRLSASQRQEADKYQRINELRDNPKARQANTSFWDKF